ncbi:hypothetical protein PR048_027200 [Dryococelus australis]|uniref:tRNA-uridine aminocarboxypropyltransferase 1 n=1 Tax=Dryococelus australis TaxID=614101 RepID=A0ABQ9GGJ7_9NEOP|nr:hypothetical protein PR048_027200 [Dryococelus australis]
MLTALPCVILDRRVSQFWRHQKGSPRWYLATVEAVHQFCVELHMASQEAGQPQRAPEEDNENGSLYAGEYDNLLFFFCYMYTKIHTLYNHDDLRAYKRPLK